jgi:Domain of unknown function (DUF1844)
MEREEEKPKAFKVDDRRRFSSEGDLKPEFRGNDETVAEAESRPAAAAPPAPSDRPPEAKPDPLGQRTDAATSADAGASTGALHEHSGHGGAAPEITFGTFLVSLSTQALMQLGDIPDPQTGKPEQDLVGAQQLIDIIGMLQQKTRGNLDRDEAQLIEAVLYELRMKYVERARPAR